MWVLQFSPHFQHPSHPSPLLDSSIQYSPAVVSSPRAKQTPSPDHTHAHPFLHFNTHPSAADHFVARFLHVCPRGARTAGSKNGLFCFCLACSEIYTRVMPSNFPCMRWVPRRGVWVLATKQGGKNVTMGTGNTVVVLIVGLVGVLEGHALDATRRICLDWELVVVRHTPHGAWVWSGRGLFTALEEKMEVWRFETCFHRLLIACLCAWGCFALLWEGGCLNVKRCDWVQD